MNDRIIKKQIKNFKTNSPPFSVYLNIPTIGIRARLASKQLNHWKEDPK